MRRSQRLIAAAVLTALCSALAGCGGGGMANFDPSDMLDFLDTKKKLAGDRKPVFPEGVPGLEQGVPKELYKGSQQEQLDQQNAAAAAAQPAPPPEPPKPSQPTPLLPPLPPPLPPPRRNRTGPYLFSVLEVRGNRHAEPSPKSRTRRGDMTQDRTRHKMLTNITCGSLECCRMLRR